MRPPERPSILHVVERSSEASADFDRAIDEAGFDLDYAETTYGAMARLVRPEGGPPQAVIVCVDCLDTPELEFFTLTARLYPNLPVYVYGRSADGLRRQRALALGARSEVTANRFAALLVDLVTTADEDAAVAGRFKSADVATPSRQDPGTADAARESEPVLPYEARKEPVSEEHTSQASPPSTAGRIPTPWHPASDRPRRIAPGERCPPDPLAEPRGTAADRPAPQRTQPLVEPLLSRQEMDALLSERPDTEPQPETTRDVDE
jgi:hypothetical protein